MKAQPNSATPAEQLAPYAGMKLRAFLLRGRSDRNTEALYALLYGRTIVTHSTALAVEAELEASTRTVADVIGGWRPKALEVQ